MRKVTEETARALYNQESMRSGNTQVSKPLSTSNTSNLHLHGNLIASYTKGLHDVDTLTLRDAGWTTLTTKERLNGILQAFALPYGIVQKNYRWYLVKYQYEPDFKELERTEWEGTKVFDV